MSPYMQIYVTLPYLVSEAYRLSIKYPCAHCAEACKCELPVICELTILFILKTLTMDHVHSQ